jgi:predicted acylesterase/phospholipase RssA
MEQIEFEGLAVKSDLKIGLALSGGGFRASIFHLGVIRRLEELGLMKKISVISAVSGGSIIAAYYVIEMERRLRETLSQLEQGKKTLDQLRMEAFEGIANDFFAALDYNLRCRAVVFAPFYHPFQWIKSLWPGYSRSHLMQAEYDKRFYDGNPLDQLPSVDVRMIKNERFVFGPKLILNATSLIDGRRVSFSRIPIGRFEQFTKVDKNVLKLSQVVAASAAVPGVFPPVAIGGEKLVDGGVADNQGVEALLKEETGTCSDPAKKMEFDVLLVSDASGQVELIDGIKDTSIAVMNRVMSVLQFQVRQKLIDLLVGWKITRTDPQKEFAFVHLFLNLKDRSGVPRVPSEYIPPLGRLRTDLDQFSPVEREALMYHGYTLIDAQIRLHCKTMLVGYIEQQNNGNIPAMTWPPLFSYENQLLQENPPKTEMSFAECRHWIKRELTVGAGGMLIVRSVKKYPWTMWPVVLLTWIIPLVMLYWLGIRTYMNWLTDNVGQPVLGYLKNLCPVWVRWLFSEHLGFLQWPLTAKGATIIVCMGLAAYLLLFLMFHLVRWAVEIWDAVMYRKLTGGKAPSVHWDPIGSQEIETIFKAVGPKKG